MTTDKRNKQMHMYVNTDEKVHLEESLRLFNSKRFTSMNMSEYLRMLAMKQARTIISHANDDKFITAQVAANPSTQSHSQTPSESQR